MKWTSLFFGLLLLSLYSFGQITKKQQRETVSKNHYLAVKPLERKQLYYQKLSLHTTNKVKQKIYADSSAYFMKLISKRVIATRHQIQKIGYDEKRPH
jgi:hypothetical protein